MSDVETGVYYAAGDYVGFFRRALIDLVDGVVLVIAWSICIEAIVILSAGAGGGPPAAIFAVVGIAFAYLVILKRYAFTLGYLLLGAQVVNLQGKAPSMGALTIRALFLFIGPGNTLLDLIWLTSDPDRQAIRDRFARTYVVSRNTRPAGSGHIRYTRLDLLCFNMLLPEVARES